MTRAGKNRNEPARFTFKAALVAEVTRKVTGGLENAGSWRDAEPT
jgi:hypothetical protein